MIPMSPPSPSSTDSATPQVSYRPVPLTLTHSDPEYQLGQLHLVPCSLEQYLDLPYSTEDRYDLVEGILISQAHMSDFEHDDNIDRLAAELFRAHCMDDDSKLTIVTSRSFHIAEKRKNLHGGTSASRRAVHTVRRPDIAIGDLAFQTYREKLTEQEGKFTFPLGHPPLLALEYTSTPSSRKTDIEVKTVEYAEALVPTYVIVDRDIPSRSDPKVIVCSLKTKNAKSVYEKQEYREDQIVQCPYITELQMTANEILYPQRSVNVILNSPRKRQKDAVIKTQDSEIKELKAQLKKSKEKRKKDKKAMQEAGLPVSPSSSSSPPTSSSKRAGARNNQSGERA